MKEMLIAFFVACSLFMMQCSLVSVVEHVDQNSSNSSIQFQGRENIFYDLTQFQFGGMTSVPLSEELKSIKASLPAAETLLKKVGQDFTENFGGELHEKIYQSDINLGQLFELVKSFFKKYDQFLRQNNNQSADDVFLQKEIVEMQLLRAVFQNHPEVLRYLRNKVRQQIEQRYAA